MGKLEIFILSFFSVFLVFYFFYRKNFDEIEKQESQRIFEAQEQRKHKK